MEKKERWERTGFWKMVLIQHCIIFKHICIGNGSEYNQLLLLYLLDFNLDVRKIFYDNHFLWFVLFIICLMKNSAFFYRLNLIFLNEKFWRVGDRNKVLECCKVDNFKGSFLIETKAKLKKCKFSQGDPMYVLLMKSYWIPIYIMGGLL